MCTFKKEKKRGSGVLFLPYLKCHLGVSVAYGEYFALQQIHNKQVLQPLPEHAVH